MKMDDNNESEETEIKFEAELLHLTLQTILDELDLLKSIVTLHRESYNLPDYEKITKIHSKVRAIFMKLMEELLRTNSFEAFKSEIYLLELEHEQETAKQDEIRAVDLEYNQIQSDKLQQDRDSYLSFYKATSSQGIITDELQNTIKENLIKEKILRAYLEAQVHQKTLKMQEKEQTLINRIAELNKTMENEQRIFSELEAFHSECTKDLEERLNNWMEMYKKDVGDFESQIKFLTDKLETQRQEIKNLRDTFNVRNSAIEAYEELKEKRRIEREQFEKLNVLVTRIQSWWRGVMVRRKLGPYKPKKTRGKGKLKASKK